MLLAQHVAELFNYSLIQKLDTNENIPIDILISFVPTFIISSGEKKEKKEY